jgi:nucleotide-binding universal stress UspA family protein
MEGVMRILLAIDGSAPSDLAVAEVARRPWPDGSAVRLISCIERATLPGYDTLGLSASYYEGVVKSNIARATTAVERAVETVRAGAPGVASVEGDTVEGSPKQAILDESDRWGADLVVVGSHGYGNVARFIMGSVSHAVALHAKANVLVVRARHHDTTNTK